MGPLRPSIIWSNYSICIGYRNILVDSTKNFRLKTKIICFWRNFLRIANYLCANQACYIRCHHNKHISTWLGNIGLLEASFLRSVRQTQCHAVVSSDDVYSAQYRQCQLALWHVIRRNHCRQSSLCSLLFHPSKLTSLFCCDEQHAFSFMLPLLIYPVKTN